MVAPTLPGLDPVGHTLADLWATRVSPDGHPFAHLRPMLTSAGIRSVADLFTGESDRRVHVAGLVTHRQRPGTAGGVTFLNLEDETGMLNVICTQGVWKRYRQVARNANGMVVRGVVERQDGVTNLLADRISAWRASTPTPSGRCRADKARPATSTRAPPGHRVRDRLAGAHRALHVAVPDGRGLGAGPVDPADGLAQGMAVRRPHARREVGAVAAAGELLGHPVALEVLDRCQRTRAEVAGEALEHRALAGRPARGGRSAGRHRPRRNPSGPGTPRRR